jgi:hypothetical protein
MATGWILQAAGHSARKPEISRKCKGFGGITRLFAERRRTKKPIRQDFCTVM